MTIHVGVQPGGKGNFAVCALFWEGRFPATVIRARTYSGVDEVLADIMGVMGEWGALDTVAIGAPLTWSGTPSGWRKCDRALLAQRPPWTPASWMRAPNSLPGAVSVQGPALTWALAKEARDDVLKLRTVVETQPRLCLSYVASHLQTAVLDYRRREVELAARRAHAKSLANYFVEHGSIRLNDELVDSADAVDAMVGGLVALGLAAPETGLVIQELPGGDIRPVGKRSLAILRALP